jgi:hypothetical protein
VASSPWAQDGWAASTRPRGTVSLATPLTPAPTLTLTLTLSRTQTRTRTRTRTRTLGVHNLSEGALAVGSAVGMAGDSWRLARDAQPERCVLDACLLRA